MHYQLHFDPYFCTEDRGLAQTSPEGQEDWIFFVWVFLDEYWPVGGGGGTALPTADDGRYHGISQRS